MFHGSSFGRPNMLRNSERLMHSSDRRSDSSAGSRVSAASSVTPIAIANGQARPE
jgi:hypothetical protein